MRVTTYALWAVLPLSIVSCANANKALNFAPKEYALIVTGDDVVTATFARGLRTGNGKLRHIGIDELNPDAFVVVIENNLRPFVDDGKKYARYNVSIQTHDRKKIIEKLSGVCDLNRIPECSVLVLGEIAEHVP